MICYIYLLFKWFFINHLVNLLKRNVKSTQVGHSDIKYKGQISGADLDLDNMTQWPNNPAWNDGGGIKQGKVSGQPPFTANENYKNNPPEPGSRFSS